MTDVYLFLPMIKGSFVSPVDSSLRRSHVVFLMLIVHIILNLSLQLREELQRVITEFMHYSMDNISFLESL